MAIRLSTLMRQAGVSEVPLKKDAEPIAIERTKHTRTKMDPNYIEGTIEVFQRVCRSGHAPGSNLESAIVAMLKELQRLKTP